MLPRALAASVLVTWPGLLLADELPQDHPLGGKADDLVTATLVTLLVAGLLAAGWVRPLWALLAAPVYAVAVPLAYEAIAPTECPPGLSGIDCLPVSYGAPFLAVPAALLVLAGALLRAVALSRRERRGGPDQATAPGRAAGGRRRRP